MSQSSPLFAFDGAQRIAAGSYGDLACKVSTYLQAKPDAQLLVFNADTGKQVDLDLRGTQEEIRARAADAALTAPARATKGRPKLGVVAREVTLLPRHWDWLAAQPGGASHTLRKLIERAIKEPDPAEQQQARAAAAYHFMHAVAGNLPGFEEAARLLFAGRLRDLAGLIAPWPGDIAGQVLQLASPAAQPEPA